MADNPVPLLYPSRLARFNIGAGGSESFTISTYTAWLITKLCVVTQGTSVSDLILVYMNGQEFDAISAAPSPTGVNSYIRDYWMVMTGSDAPGLEIQSAGSGSAAGYFTGYVFVPES